MSMRRLALLGSRAGAWVSIKGMPSPTLRVTGSNGTQVVAELVLEDGQPAQRQDFKGDGEYELPEASFVRVSCGEGNTKMICDIVSRQRVA